MRNSGYGDDLKIETLDEHEDYFTVHGGMVYYDGMFYGDWSVYSKDNPAAPKKCEKFDPQKARVPEEYRTRYAGLEFNRELVLSPDHISEECNNAIIGTEAGDDPTGPLGMLSVYGEPYGARIFTTFDTDDELPETEFPELDRLLSFAKEMGCKWLVFDYEVPPCSKFETFDGKI